MRTTDEELWGTNFAGGMPSLKKEQRYQAKFTLNDLAALHRESYAIVDQLLSIFEVLPKINEDTLLQFP